MFAGFNSFKRGEARTDDVKQEDIDSVAQRLHEELQGEVELEICRDVLAANKNDYTKAKGMLSQLVPSTTHTMSVRRKNQTRAAEKGINADHSNLQYGTIDMVLRVKNVVPTASDDEIIHALNNTSGNCCAAVDQLLELTKRRDHGVVEDTSSLSNHLALDFVPTKLPPPPPEPDVKRALVVAAEVRHSEDTKLERLCTQFPDLTRNEVMDALNLLDGDERTTYQYLHQVDAEKKEQEEMLARLQRQDVVLKEYLSHVQNSAVRNDRNTRDDPFSFPPQHVQHLDALQDELVAATTGKAALPRSMNRRMGSGPSLDLGIAALAPPPLPTGMAPVLLPEPPLLPSSSPPLNTLAKGSGAAPPPPPPPLGTLAGHPSLAVPPGGLKAPPVFFAGAKGMAAAKRRDARATKTVFWSKIAAGHNQFETIWNDDDMSNLSLSTEDQERFRKAFEKRQDGKPNGQALMNSSSSRDLSSRKPTILPESRERNVGIVLAYLRLPLDVIQRSILRMDELTLDDDSIEGLLSIAPTLEERKLLQPYRGQEDKQAFVMTPAVRYFLFVCDTPRYESRLRTWRLKMTFEDEYEEIVHKVSCWEMGIDSLKKSSKFRRVLQHILTIGNFLNAGTQFADAKGFRVSDLSKFITTRTADNSQTLLGVLEQYLSEKEPHVCSFASELQVLRSATQVDLKLLESQVSTMRTDVNEVVSMIDLLSKENVPGDRYIQVMTGFFDSADGRVKSVEDRLARVLSEASLLGPYFAEEPGMDASVLMKHVLSFCSSFQNEQDRRMKANKTSNQGKVLNDNVATKKNVYTSSKAFTTPQQVQKKERDAAMLAHITSNNTKKNENPSVLQTLHDLL